MTAIKKTLLGSALAISVGLLASLEGYVHKPYYDIAGILTECYGNTHGVNVNKPKTHEECLTLLENENSRIGMMLLKDYEGHTSYTLASGISFVYNVGDGAYRNSTYRRKLKAGDLIGACREMNKWVYITKNGTKVKAKGLENRRAKEVELCLTGLVSQ